MDQLAEGGFQRGRRPPAPIRAAVYSMFPPCRGLSGRRRLVRVQSRETSAFPSESRATSGADGVEQ